MRTPIVRTAAALCVLSAVACASAWPPPPDRTAPGVRSMAFSVPETPPYAVRGRYVGELRERGDSVWVILDSGTVAYRRDPPGNGPGTLEYIGAGLVGPRGFSENFFIRGSRQKIGERIRVGEELPVGPFYVGATSNGFRPIDELSVRIIHRLSYSETPVAETYTWFSASIGEILRPRPVGPLR